MTDSPLKSILSSFMDRVWNKGEIEAVELFVAPAYEVKRDPGDPWEGQVLDRVTFIERVSYSRNAFPDLHFEIDEMVAEDDKVVASWVMSGTHLGDLPQLPASGRPFAISGMTIYFFEGDKVCGHTQAFDRLGFLSQIGFVG